MKDSKEGNKLIKKFPTRSLRINQLLWSLMWMDKNELGLTWAEFIEKMYFQFDKTDV